MRIKYKTIPLAVICVMLTATLAHGQSFSVAPGSPIPGDDILNPGPVPFMTGVGFEVDAFSYGHTTDFPITDFQFSIDPGSIGAPGTAAFAESGFLDQPADIYNSMGGGFNTLLWDGDGFPAPGLAPPLGLFEAPFGGEDVDGWDNRLSSAAAIYFSMDPATAPLAGPYVPADVLIAPIGPGYDGAPLPFAPALALGLDGVGGPGSDDIDALVVFDHSGALGAFDALDYVLFSLAPGSASLIGPSPYTGLGAADVMIAFAGGGGGLFAPAGALGLTPGDNLDALDVIPEPSVMMLLMVGAGGLYIRRRWFSC